MGASVALSKERRDALPAEMFAVPDRRLIPIHDDRHVRMARAQIDQMRDLSASERLAGKGHISRRAAELGIDDFESVTFEMQAMALAVPDEEHPNKMPFTGILTRVDESSDAPPGGSTGKCVFIPSAVAEAALGSLLGMGVDCTEDFSGHDSRFKIGLITEATISGNALHIAGFLYANDFPEECARIKKEKSKLGFSYECKVAISDKDADPWVVDRIVFTGAAVLYKDKAAYRTTSLAAQAELESEMELKDIAAAIDKLTASVATVVTTVEAQSKEIKDLKAGRGASLAGPIIDQVQPHVAACNACASAMEAAGVGDHPTKGHARMLRHVAAHMSAAAVSGHVPHIYRDSDYFSDSRVEANEAEVKAAKEKDDKAAADLKATQDLLASIQTELKDLKAKAFTQAEPPARRTVTPEVTALLTKIGLTASETDKLTVHNVDKTLEAAGIKGPAAIAAKLKMRQEGLLAA